MHEHVRRKERRLIKAPQKTQRQKEIENEPDTQTDQQTKKCSETEKYRETESDQWTDLLFDSFLNRSLHYP